MRHFAARFNPFLIVLSFFFVFTTLSPKAHAGMGAKRNPIYKLARGITYIVASPFQIPKEIIQTAAGEDTTWIAPLKGMTAGVGSGLYSAIRQDFAGLWDIITFWTPAGRDWKPLFETSLIPEV